MIISMFTMIFSMTEHGYVHIFQIFGVTFYINISVTDTHVQYVQSESIKKLTYMSALCAHSIGSLDIQIRLPHLIYRTTSTVNFLWPRDHMVARVRPSRQWLVAGLVPSRCLDYWLRIFNWTIGNRFLWHFNQNTNIFDVKWVNIG